MILPQGIFSVPPRGLTKTRGRKARSHDAAAIANHPPSIDTHDNSNSVGRAVDRSTHDPTTLLTSIGLDGRPHVTQFRSQHLFTVGNLTLMPRLPFAGIMEDVTGSVRMTSYASMLTLADPFQILQDDSRHQSIHRLAPVSNSVAVRF